MVQLPFDPERALGAEPPPDEPKHLTVSQAAELIKSALERHMPSPLRVIGQISNLSRPNHWFFSLKDESAVLSCVAWASSARSFRLDPKEGDEVVATGYVTHYERQGRTQLYVSRLEAVGAGALELKFRAMCDELRRLGYFDEPRKKPLPLFPSRIAVITSSAGAARHDVISTAAQRCRAVGLLVMDVRVQGEGAAEQVAAAIRRADSEREELDVDAILVTRGGGSAEDLWAFNERVVADAVFACTLPLVAAIGHESDTTVIELVADVRAATPTQAIMRLIPAASQLLEQVGHLDHRLAFLLKRLVERQRERYEAARRFALFRDPGALVRRAREAVDGRQRDLNRSGRGRVAGQQARLERLARRLHAVRPEALALRRRERMAVLADRLGRAARRRADQWAPLAVVRRRLGRAVAVHLRRVDDRTRAIARQLQSIDPNRVLTRGYSYTTTADGRLVRSVRDVRPAQPLLTRVSDGSIESIVGGIARRTPPRRSSESDRRAGPTQMDLFHRSR
ncbi:MAG: exodeoxyribonuclease VII large subunit [Planctomycetota bacterium]|jgi:exodeoxyribonuclease VII large subunit